MQHTTQAKGEWHQKSFLEQMSNIGSEIYRAINWRNKGNSDYANQAFLRSLELIDLTKDSKLTAPQYKELLRMRETWVDYFAYDNIYNSSDDSFNKYFMYLTIAFNNTKHSVVKWDFS